MTRNLAPIQTVVAIGPIANAGAIGLARIQGWQCVVKQGEQARRGRRSIRAFRILEKAVRKGWLPAPQERARD